MEPPTVQYVTTSDGYDIAYRVAGAGQPYVVVPPIYHHLELEQEVGLRAWHVGLSRRFKLIEYDSRGQGLSTRSLPETFSFLDLVIDLEAVLDRLGLESAIIMGTGTSGHTAIRFAARQPQRVRALILMSSSLITGPWWPTSLAAADWDAFLTMAANVRHIRDDAEASKQRLGRMLTQSDAVLLFGAAQASRIDEAVTKVRAHTLVLHPEHVDRPSLQQCADLTAQIPGARLALISGGFATGYGDFDSGIEVIEGFLAALPEASGPVRIQAGELALETLSRREIEILRLVASGKSNQQVADDLVISRNTVQRHVSNILAKTGAANRTEAAVYARDKGLA